MNIQVELEAIPLQNDKYMPKFTMINISGDSIKFSPYKVDQTCNSKEDVIDVARTHAKEEVGKRYSNDVSLEFNANEVKDA
jgi:hypothetical protein